MRRRTGGDNIPSRWAGLPFRPPRNVLILMPFYLPVILAIFVVSVVFTIWPDALQHTPISFEDQGLIHHVWHYSLMLGSALILVGMFWASPRRLQAELAGVFILMGALVVNMIALVAFAISPGDSEEPSGLVLGIRSGLIVGLAVRAYVIIAEPVVSIKPINGRD